MTIDEVTLIFPEFPHKICERVSREPSDAIWVPHPPRPSNAVGTKVFRVIRVN